MLKRSLVATLFVAGLVAPAVALAASRGEASLVAGGKTITVDYGKPSLAGRDMLAKAQVGDEWRLGADSPTSLKTDAALDFGGKAVAKGQYVLRARRDAEDKWTLLVRQGETIVAEVPLVTTELKDSVETLRIVLNEAKGGGELVITWGTRQLSAAFSVK
jgi:hypothetical protein